MKKTVAIIIGIAVIIALLGCGGAYLWSRSHETAAPMAPNATEAPAPTEAPQKYNDSNTRPIAIMIDNDNKDAWPHSGLNDAYLIYEMYVEGNATRMMALFKDVDTEKIGPIRSSRHYFIDYALEHDAVYAAFGWSPIAMNDLQKGVIDNINGIRGTDEKYYWRERKYKGDYHSAYTSIENLKQAMKDKGYSDQTDTKFLDYHYEITPLDSEQAANTFTLQYSGFYKITYQYNEAEHHYERTLNGNTPHQSKDGVKYAPTNIILQEVKNYNLGDGSPRQQMDTVGSGKGKYITEGRVIDIKWSKESRAAQTKYTDSEGNELVLNPGLTWINLIPPTMTVNFE